MTQPNTVFGSAVQRVIDDFGNETTAVQCERGHWHPKPVPWEECQCSYLPHDDRYMCSKHGTDAKPQPRRVISVGRTRPLYDVSSGCSTLDKIEGIVWQATVDGELTSRQLGALRWALRKCRSLMAELRGLSESL